MMWLKKKIKNWLFNENNPAGIEIASSPVRSNGVDVDGLSFNVMAANGGVIIQTRKYERKTDRNIYSTHIITDEEDLSQRIGQIVAMEILRHD